MQRSYNFLKVVSQQPPLLLLKLYNLIDKLTANKLPCLVPILLKLLKKILLIAIRIYYCIIPYYLVYKHSYLLTYCLLIYIRIISRDRLLSFNSIKGNITMFNNSYNNSNSNSNAKI
ncbi:hypothetical protein HBH48_122480 [Parastagonospora nodorum]|nr:hypothetical protein HBH48_122480 [Parastagonospora nodorum]